MPSVMLATDHMRSGFLDDRTSLDSRKVAGCYQWTPRLASSKYRTSARFRDRVVNQVHFSCPMLREIGRRTSALDKVPIQATKVLRDIISQPCYGLSSYCRSSTAVAASKTADKNSATTSSTHQSSSEATENFGRFTGRNSSPVSSGSWSI
jgi:hypothetical protein